MAEQLICQVAVSVAAYDIDKPYSYLVPASLGETLRPGMRVVVPFGRGNKTSEGIVLQVGTGEAARRLKWVSALLDAEPVVDDAALRLALWMREMYFCTVYDAVKAMLPAGLYYNLQDELSLAPEAMARTAQEQEIFELLEQNGGILTRQKLQTCFGGRNLSKTLQELIRDGLILVKTSAQRGVGDKAEEIAVLAVSPEEAMLALEQSRSKHRRAVVELLTNTGAASAKEVRYYTGATRRVLKDLEKLGIVTLFQREVFRRPAVEQVEHQPAPALNGEQTAAAEGLQALLDGEKAACALLYGVTGSGKTEVYISLIHHVLAQHKTALVLVPEIGLTPQLLARFVAQFGEQVAVLHSSLSAGERYDEWKRVRRGEAPVVIGTRSAVFAPLPRLGLVVLDEEQEASYKSEQIPRYHARDVAKYRCAQSNALLLLGSATPSVESMFFAKSGRYSLFTLKNRYNGQEMPQVTIVDLKQELRNGNANCLSAPLGQALRENLENGQQTILLLNRRGTSSMVVCTDCGAVPECPRCSVHLTYHKANDRLMCHYCGHTQPMPRNCPSCGSELAFYGTGTQMLEEELQEDYPEAGVLRMDADTVSAAHPHRELLERFRKEKIPVLIGTQMVAKGLDFSNVTLVGVINADLNLFAESFRAAERTFSLLTQVVGRAGRGETPGRALIQTMSPKHEVIQAAAAQDYDRFYEQEIALRQVRHFPPWTDLVVLHISGEEEGEVLRASVRLRQGLDAWSDSPAMAEERLQIYGPAPAPVVKVNGRYRYRLTVCGKYNRAMRGMIGALLHAAASDKLNRNVSVSADWNPAD